MRMGFGLEIDVVGLPPLHAVYGEKFAFNLLKLKEAFAKNEMRYRLTAKNNLSQLILLLSVIRIKLLKILNLPSIQIQKAAKYNKDRKKN